MKGPGVETLNQLEIVPSSLTHVLDTCKLDPDINVSLLLEILLILISATPEKRLNGYSTQVFEALVDMVSSHNERVDEEDACMAARVALKLIDQDDKFELELIKDQAKLVQFMKVFLGLASYNRGDEENADLSKVCLGAVGNLSTQPAFGDAVSITTEDPVFTMVIDLLRGSFVCPSGFVNTDLEYYALFKGIGCLFLGNLATSVEKVQALLTAIPDLVELAMEYLVGETDPFGLQGAHLIKNLTASTKLSYAGSVLDHKGASLVAKLTGMKLFSNLRVLGAQIAKTLLTSSATLDTPTAVKGYIELTDIVSKVYKTEDSMDIKNELVLACDAAISESVLHKPEFEPTKVGQATSELARVVMEYLHAVGRAKGEVNAVVTLKASKALGILASTVTGDPGKETTLVEQAIEDDSESAKKLIDILDKFSSQLLEAKAAGTDETGSRAYQAIINNLGYVGAKLQKQDCSDLSLACAVAIRNASQ